MEPLPEDLPNHFDVVIASPHGLHARPATALVDIAKGFAATVRIRHGNRAGDAKSLIALLNLGVESGATIRVMAEGPDATEALAALREAIDAGLEEPEETAASAVPTEVEHIAWEGPTLAGVAASPGMAVGPVWQFQRGKIVVAATARDPAAELTRLERALESAKRELAELYEEVKAKAGAGRAAIFKAHAEFLDDRGLMDAAEHLIRDDARSAGYAWERSFMEQAKVLAAQKDALLAARAVDLRDVGGRVLRLLAERDRGRPQAAGHPGHPDRGRPDAHRTRRGSNPALALGICTASAAGPPPTPPSSPDRWASPPWLGPAIRCSTSPTGRPSFWTATAASWCWRRRTRTARSPRGSRPTWLRQREAERRACYQPAIMTDGARIEVVANIAAPDEAAQAVEAGGEGVGLLRTEFLFLGRDQAPTEDEQFEALQRDGPRRSTACPSSSAPWTSAATRRCPTWPCRPEDNPFLGERGIRLCLNRPELFRTQLRAIFRAAALGPVRIMFPMIATLEELGEPRP